MSLLKSFDEFESKGSDKAAKASPKSKTNENILKNKKVKGKETQGSWLSPGGQRKIKWKSQNNQSFIIKIKNDKDVLDGSHQITKPVGEGELINFFNTQQGFRNKYGTKLDDTFFNNNIIVYTVKRDKDKFNTPGVAKLQKIQFTIFPRPAGLAKDIRFIPSAHLKNASLLTIQQDLLNTDKEEELIAPVKKKCISGFVWDEKTQDCIKKEKVKLAGVCPGTTESDVYFEYTSGENNKAYTIKEHEQGMHGGGFRTYRDDEISDTGIITDEGSSGTHNFRYTGDNSNKSGWIMDSKQDVDFWTRVYNEPEYLCELLLAFKKKYPKGKNKASIKDKMYYSKSKTKIYTNGGKSFNMNFTIGGDEEEEATGPKYKYDLAKK